MSASLDKFGRRLVLTAAVCAARQVAAQTTVRVSQEAAKYQNTPRGGLTCAACTFFRRPVSCEVVDGVISPNGWCQLFDMPD